MEAYPSVPLLLPHDICLVVYIELRGVEARMGSKHCPGECGKHFLLMRPPPQPKCEIGWRRAGWRGARPFGPGTRRGGAWWYGGDAFLVSTGWWWINDGES